MVFVKNSTFFLYVLFFSKKSQEERFFDILDTKECFLDLKKEVLSKSKKIDILQRGQSMAFLNKSGIFSYLFFFLSQESQKETFFDILDRKECFFDHKRKVLKNSKKAAFCKGVSPWFLSKNRPFSQMFFFLAKNAKKKHFLLFCIVKNTFQT